MSLINISRKASHSDAGSDIQESHSRFAVALLAAVLGLVMVFGVGFVQGNNGAVHNAAHDTRHSMAFPCH